jgi:hypothetical protein
MSLERLEQFYVAHAQAMLMWGTVEDRLARIYIRLQIQKRNWQDSAEEFFDEIGLHKRLRLIDEAADAALVGSPLRAECGDTASGLRAAVSAASRNRNELAHHTLVLDIPKGYTFRRNVLDFRNPQLRQVSDFDAWREGLAKLAEQLGHYLGRLENVIASPEIAVPRRSSIADLT